MAGLLQVDQRLVSDRVMIAITRCKPVAERYGIPATNQLRIEAKLADVYVLRSRRLIGQLEGVSIAPTKRGQDWTVFGTGTTDQDDFGHPSIVGGCE